MLLAITNFRELSENSVNAKFREFPFHALGCIRARRRLGTAKPRLAL
jgi:hypothetical protein